MYMIVSPQERLSVREPWLIVWSKRGSLRCSDDCLTCESRKEGLPKPNIDCLGPGACSIVWFYEQLNPLFLCRHLFLAHSDARRCNEQPTAPSS